MRALMVTTTISKIQPGGTVLILLGGGDRRVRFPRCGWLEQKDDNMGTEYGISGRAEGQACNKTVEV